MHTQEIWKHSLNEAHQVLQQYMDDASNIAKLGKLSQAVSDTFKNEKTIFTCGNGGSHCDAMHFAEEWTGRYRRERKPLGALALGDASHMSCVGNDYGFEHVFERQLSALGRSGDLVIFLSTSGQSKNLILAAQAARQHGIRSFALLGKGGGDLKSQVDDFLIVPGATSDRIQELHMLILHICIEVVERELFPGNY